jgi:hypothetical protein
LVPVPAEAEAVEPYARPGSGSTADTKPGKNKPKSAAAAEQAKTAGQPKAESHASSAKPIKPARPTEAPSTSPPRATVTPAAPTAPPAPPAPSPPVAVAPVPAAPAAARGKVVVPRTANVHIDYPAGLQADLDADPRMQAWVDKVIAVIDGCHAKNRSAKGTIATRITMHENDRPDADILSLPGALSSVVACATGSLMRIKMPLFTGREGTRYDVRIAFE